MTFKCIVPLALFLTALPASLSHAASDGRPGATSTGQIFIRLEFSQSVQVSNLKDIELAVENDALVDGIETTQQFCVRGSKGGYYRLVAQSDRGGSTPFSLTGDGGETIAFNLFFTGQLSSNVLEPMTPGVPSRNYAIQSNGIYCNGEDNAEIAIHIPAQEIQSKSDRIFSGYLNLTVAVE